MRWLARRYPIAALIARGHSRFDRGFLIYSTIAGAGQASILAIVNAAASSALNAEVNSWYLALFVISVTIFLTAQYHVMSTAAEEFERVLDQIRIGISNHIVRAELESLEHIGHSEIYAVVNRETVIISQVAAPLTLACQSAMMMLFSAVYLERLSTLAFILTAVFALIGTRVFLAKRDEAVRRLNEAGHAQNEFFECLIHLIDGFKEVRLHAPRARAMLFRLRQISAQLRSIKSNSERGFAEQFTFAQAVLYPQIIGVVFLLPRLSPTFPSVVMQATAAVLFIIGPMANLVAAVPVIERANAASKNVLALEDALARAEAPEEEGPDSPVHPDQPIVLDEIEFHYESRGGDAGFTVGPISFTIQPGRILFLVGGNGSGKSTLLKVLTGLYHPQGGTIRVGSTPFTRNSAAWYRSYFTAIFAEYHLFDRLYGLEGIDPDRVRAELERMQLDTKVRFENRRFSTLELSSGQRKRLALAVRLLEDRPVLVFDEWAAEQDPAFRNFFYTSMLPLLRSQGKTIIAATHDDRYFGVADQIVKMEYGAVTELVNREAPPAGDGPG